MKKNVAGQVIGAQMVSATDGSAFTGAVTCYVCGDGGTQAAGSVGSGACTHEGNGYHTYAPAQAETNYDLVAFTFTGTGAVPATVQVFTGYPQTGDAYARLGAPAGASVSADIADVEGKVDDLESRLGTPADLGSGATVAANLADIEAQTDDIGAAGAGLTAVPWNAAWDAEVQSEATDALNAYDPPTKAELDSAVAPLATSAALTTVDGIVDAILVDTGTTLPAAIAAISAGMGSGTGTYTDTVTDGVNPLDGVRVQLSTDSAKANPVYQAYTDALGVFLMYPDPGTYYVWFEKAGYDFSAVNGTGVTVT